LISEPTVEPHRILKGFSTLTMLTGIYPVGHPLVADKAREVYEAVQPYFSAGGVGEWVRIDVIRGVVHLNGVPAGGPGNPQANGLDSLHIRVGVQPEEIAAAAEVMKVDPSRALEPVNQQLVRRGVQHISVGRLVPLDTRWRSRQWPDYPQQALDPDYEESLLLAQQAFEGLSEDRRIDLQTVHDLVRLLMCRVVTSNAAIAQILAVKQYENLTYIHSVNVAVLSLLLGKQLGLDDPMLASLVEAGVLHDVGKTRIPLDVVKKAGTLDKHERKLMEAHAVQGAELLMQVDGLRPLTAVVALEHHRSVLGKGYPDLGDGVVPHLMSQIVSVADIYEAVTGARSYQQPTPPERACLLIARLAGTKLNTALVKAFVNAITFFPVGSVVRTSRGELGVVLRTTAGDPLHPVIQLLDEDWRTPRGVLDTSARGEGDAYDCHIVETVAPVPEAFDVRQFLSAA
jgi:HD-GYP domain-containing protein (c-di-GMP phosphodiesterase class II)